MLIIVSCTTPHLILIIMIQLKIGDVSSSISEIVTSDDYMNFRSFQSANMLRMLVRVEIKGNWKFLSCW